MKRQLALCIGILAMGITATAQSATVAVIEIRTEIGKGLSRYIERSIAAAAEQDADAIVFDMHTPGGRVDAMGEIVNHIFDTDLPTIAYVRTEAISAGAVIALACDQIVMAPGSTFGDAAPVSGAGEELGEKAVSYIRGKIRATAERNGRNSDVAEAMVDKKKVLVRLKGVEGGGIELLSPAQFQSRQEAGDEFEIISHEGELLTLTTDAALDLHFVETRANTLEELLATYSIVEDADGMRVMSAAQIAAAQQSPDAKLTVIESLDGATVTRFQRSLLESLSIAVTSSMIGSLLLSLGMLGIMIEFRTPGFGIPGIIGLACIGLFFGGHMIADVGASWGLIAFLVGLGLLGLELFVIPGFGIAGISGIALMLGGLLFVFGQNAPTFTAAVSSLGLSLGVAVALMVVVAFTLPRTRAWNRLILSNEERAIDGYRSASAELVALLGVNGVALTTLRPAGTAEIGSERVDVVSEGAFIPAQTRVRVVQVEGGRVVVRPVTDEAMTAQEGLTNG